MRGADRESAFQEIAEEFLRSLTDEQIDGLIAGRMKLTVTRNSGYSRPSKRDAREKVDTAHICAELGDKQTREEGIMLLDELALPKASLQEVAAALDLPSPKTDTVTRLRERIIEATIGFRLRSEAIRSAD